MMRDSDISNTAIKIAREHEAAKKKGRAKTHENMPLIWVQDIRPRFELSRTQHWMTGELEREIWRVRSERQITPHDFRTWIFQLIDPGQGYSVRKQPEVQIGGYWQDDLHDAHNYDPIPFYEYYVETVRDISTKEIPYESSEQGTSDQFV